MVQLWELLLLLVLDDCFKSSDGFVKNPIALLQVFVGPLSAVAFGHSILARSQVIVLAIVVGVWGGCFHVACAHR